MDEIFSMLKEAKIAEAISYVKEGKLKNVDSVDEHGTTVLQYAAFRGYYELCDLLIKAGADVNAKTHDQGYSALMFATISNHKRVVHLLLENDADVDYTNQIGRTASQMASFVNANESVDVINSYIPKRELEYFTQTHSPYEKEPKLPAPCLDPLHRLLIKSNNFSPIFVLKSIREAPVLVKHIDRVIGTLDAFVTKVFKVGENSCPNDLLAFKLHYYKYLFEFVRGQQKVLRKRQETEEGEEEEEKHVEKLFETAAKTLLVEEKIVQGRDEKCRLFQEKFLRESIRQFPYKECALLRQMVTILARTPLGQSPSALYVITSCLNGQKLNSKFDDDNEEGQKISALECKTCTVKNLDVKLCTHCRVVAYCDKFCQKVHWPIHKNEIK